jgi:integrase
LRIGEACRLVVSDLDSDRGAIWVLGKGQKERLAALHPPLLVQLRAYWHAYRPVAPWLFTGKYGLPLDPDQARKVFKAAVLATGLAKRATPHPLRHTYATLLLEHGTGLPVIQALLGHGALSSTERNLHVATHLIRGRVDPMELLPPQP